MTNILFTGFEPFGRNVFNPSAIVAEEAARTTAGAYELLEVTFDSARRAAAQAAEFEFVVHVGLAAATDWIRLERFGHNLRMVSDDPAEENDPDAVMRLDDGPLARETSFELGGLRRGLLEADWDVRHWRDAGTYVCNALYYHSLAVNPRALFVHVPAWSREEAASFGRDLGREIVRVIDRATDRA